MLSCLQPGLLPVRGSALAENRQASDAGFFDHESCRMEAADNPFGVEVLPMSSE